MDFGDLGDLGKNISVIIPLILLVAFQIITRKRRGEKTLQDVIISLVNEINHNQQLMEAFMVKWQTKKFQTGSWKRNKNRVNSLDQSVQVALADTYQLAEDFNSQIENAKKFKTSSYLANINIDKLKEPLARSRKGLEEWLQTNSAQQSMPTRRRGLFG